jgi:hypothetical protein
LFAPDSVVRSDPLSVLDSVVRPRSWQTYKWLRRPIVKNSWFKLLSVLTVFVLLMAVVAVLSPSRPADAGAGETATVAAAHAKPKPEGTDKVLITNLTPPDILSAFLGPAGPDGTLPKGIFEGAVTAPAAGVTVEMFIPVGQDSSLYVFGPTGYHFLQTVNPTGSEPNIQIDASKALTTTSVLTFTVPSLTTKDTDTTTKK